MPFDLRLPTGLLFLLLGFLLTGYGLAGPQDIYRASLDMNVNLGWGLTLLAVGAGMLALALRARQG